MLCYTCVICVDERSALPCRRRSSLPACPPTSCPASQLPPPPPSFPLLQLSTNVGIKGLMLVASEVPSWFNIAKAEKMEVRGHKTRPHTAAVPPCCS